MASDLYRKYFPPRYPQYEESYNAILPEHSVTLLLETEENTGFVPSYTDLDECRSPEQYLHVIVTGVLSLLA